MQVLYPRVCIWRLERVYGAYKRRGEQFHTEKVCNLFQWLLFHFQNTHKLTGGMNG